MSNYNEMNTHGGVPVKLWTRGVPVEDEAMRQLAQLARLPVVWPHVAVMPDVHVGIGATVGSVVPTRHAIIPAAVGVDIGCGMIAARTSLHANDLPDNLAGVRSAIEKAVPHGRSTNKGQRDKGAWNAPPRTALQAWTGLEQDFKRLCELHPRLKNTNNLNHLGTLGTGNHFIEVCLDEDNIKNFTRFLVLSQKAPERTGRDKTSLMLSVKDKVGALYDLLRPFASHGLNMTKIESRPSRRKAWEYIFFVDIEGHIDEERVKKAADEVKSRCLFMKILGSYPAYS